MKYREVKIHVRYEGYLLYSLTVVADGAMIHRDHALRHNVAKVRNQWCEEMAEQAAQVEANAIPFASDMRDEEQIEETEE